MGFLLRLPFQLVELLLRRLFGRSEQQRFAPTSRPTPARDAERAAAPAFTTAAPPPPSADGPPPPTADEAIERRLEREAAEVALDVTPPTPLRPIGDVGHVDEEVELVESFGPADDVGATLRVDEPWDGYGQQPAAAIIARLRGADPATKAVVALYERSHKRRATVLRATG